MRTSTLALLGLTFCTLLLAQAEPAAAQVVFTKAERVATGLLASFRGVFATAFFGIAFVVTGFLAAFNRISWAWVALVVVGAFLVFAGPTIVANLRSSFS
ncbi:MULTISPECIES: TrbC/VirB2 family protein [Paracoccaceae]|jgi:type IV secretory pathway VirB2 component (pilin)|uniref:TrbC/VirB2 family protein n=1 Tax=Paracoccaceae TaxID=31989 RepID=UPI000B6AD172|nr:MULTISPECIES: TrbC/VirB2 family protein [Paracoccaceae]SNT34390.1 TrbC/VIRB2 family protein [[Luteovulum] sphaeroides subsp. megalophilum]